ncbi:tail fiber protein [Salmonella phage SP01]|uniref:Tail fiber protein n=1 Tax=Salmonella phage SP01 TaxID=1920294 RepID=A0A291NKN8_9CAUD|nr:tail fiber protein [Salmonella phage SP01]ATI99395.1 tail fiber protein [Salmonella phage SP01]
MAITKIILQQMVTMDQNSVTASKYPKYTIVLGNTISSITAAELTSAIESSKASAAAAKQSEINAKQSELNAKDSENEAEISATSSQQSATQSASSATASANSAKAAKTSETNAKASETAAKTSETNAKASETAAKTSENEAEISATSSQQSATQSASSATQSANSATASANSATASANSAKAAKTSETNAKASETAAKTSETNAKASETAAKTSETNANSSKTAAAASASAAKTSETNAAASASAAKTSETNAAASASAAKTSETNASSSKTAAANSASAAKVSETNAKTSETNAAASATKAENAASGMRDSIGLGNVPRNCPDISGNPSAYIGFMRIMSTAVGFPSIASGESSLTGFISQVDGTPSYTGVFQGWASRSLYTYRWNPTIGPEWTRHARKNEVDKLVQLSPETQLLNPGNNAKIIITSNKLWGAYDIENRTYIPLAVGQGGTGGRSAAEARTNFGLSVNDTPQFRNLNLVTVADTAQAPSGIISGYLNNSSGIQRCRYRIYSEIRGDNKAWLTLHLQSDTATNKYAGLSVDGNFQINGNFIGNAISLSDVATSKVNLQVNRFVQATGETDVVNHAGTAQIFITDNKNWGAYDKELRRPIALPITQGGTGALTAAEARNNLNVFGRGEYGLGAGAVNLDWANVATSGSGFYASQVNPPISGVTCAGFLTNFAGNYAFALAGRNNRAFIRTTESGVNNEWVELLKQGDYGIGASSGAVEISDAATADSLTLESGLYMGNGDHFGTPFGVGNGQYIGLLSTNCTKNNLFKSQLAFSYSSNGRMFYRSMSNGSFRAWREVCFTDNPVFDGVMGITRTLGGVQKSAAFSVGNTDVYMHNPTSNKYLQLKDDGTLKYSDTLVMLSDRVSNYTVGPDFALRNAGSDYMISNSGNAASGIYNRLWGSTSRPTVWEVGPQDGSGYFFYAQSNTDKSRVLNVNGSVQARNITQSSDRDLKDNIEEIQNATESLRKMKGYTYTLKENGAPYAGVIAQEVMEALPEAVSGFTKYTDLEGPTLTGEQLVGEERFYSVDYAAITGLLVQAGRESDSRITALESEVSDLKKQIADLTLVVNSLLANRAQ